jgi:hypothetical protein
VKNFDKGFALQLQKTDQSDSSLSLCKRDMNVLEAAGSGDPGAIGVLVDEWAGRFFGYTDALRIHGRDAEQIVEEMLRRLAFDAPRFVARPEKLASWVQRTFKECAGAVLLRKAHKNGWSEPRTHVGQQFSRLVREGRIADALGFLNSQTPFRFTAVYRIDGLRIANVYLYDRLAGLGTDGSAGPVANTFCVWVQETMSVVQMADSQSDPRAIGHPKRDVVRSYCGGPIAASDGQLLGTVCHFDFDAQAEIFDIMPVLQEIGPSLAGLISA